MKKLFLTVILTTVLLAGGAIYLFSQEQPQPQRDTVTTLILDATPESYWALEDEENRLSKGSKEGSFGTIAIIAAVGVVAAGAVILFLKKKKVHPENL